MNIENLKRKVFGHHPCKGDSGGGGGGGSDYSNEGRNYQTPTVETPSTPEYTGPMSTNWDGTGATGDSWDAEFGTTGQLEQAMQQQEAAPPAPTMTEQETQQALDDASKQAILVSRPDLPSTYYGSTWDYDPLDKGWREKVFDATSLEGLNPVSKYLKDLGLKGAGMSYEQMSSTETPEEAAARYQAWNDTINTVVNAVTPAQFKAMVALARGIDSGDVGGAIGGFVGSNSGIPMGGSIGTLAGRSIQNNTPPSLDAVSRIVGTYAGSKIGGQYGTAGSMIGGYLGSNIGGSWGSNANSSVSSPKSESAVGGVANGTSGDGGDDNGFNSWAGKGGKSIISKAVGGL